MPSVKPDEQELMDLVIGGSLFTQYFLEEGIQRSPDYKAIAKSELEEAFRGIQEKYNELNLAQEPDEADTEDDLIEPILDIFGFSYLRQKQPGSGITDRPDYLLLPDKEAKQAARQDKAYQYERGIAILEAKRFRRALDKRDADPLDRGIPSNQILRYLSDADVASDGKILWGILTNGRIWRLYYHKARFRTEGYIKFDLDPLLNSEGLFQLSEGQVLEVFKLFYLFFRKDTFIPTAERPFQTFLEYALEEGKNYEERVTEDLKKKIFDEIFVFLAKGFREDAERKDQQINQGFLDEIYHNTLALLYRLLFILYAEDRDLLPVRESGYREYSLHKLKEEIYTKELNELSQRATTYWDELKSLFRIINEGDPSLNVPTYNGGLFDPEIYHFLEKYAIADNYLAHAIELLSHDHTEGDPKRINYRDLGVRQLGSIYEGLLEFKLKLAEEDLVVVKEKGKEVYLSKERANGKRVLGEVQEGELYITNDKSQRKVTGSYYTPDYIVQYIVENTIGPLIEEIEQSFEDRIKELKSDSKYKGQSARWKTVELEEKADPIQKILELKILDPAMGSGHFLVGAVDFITDWINELLEKYSGQVYFGKEVYESSLYEEIERIRQSILQNAEEQGIKLDAAKLEDKHIIKRMVLKRCVYGVDLNPMAVELAKLSLWLDSFTVGAPLSFLDHHLKCGNSLIGTLDVSEHIIPSSPRYRKFLQAVNYMVLIGQLTDSTISETQKSAKLFESANELLWPFKIRLNVSLAAKHFMNISKTRQGQLETAVFSDEGKLEEEIAKDYEEAQGTADQKHFFHWELEFPEVFYQENGRRKENPGFDTVIGNPPYINAIELNKLLSEYEKPFWKRKFVSASGAYDIYILFFELGLQLVAKERFVSLITPNKFLSAPYAVAFRKLIASEHEFTSLCNWSKCKVFEDPAVYPIVSVFRRMEKSLQPYVIHSLTADIDGNLSAQVIMHEGAKLTMLPDFLWGFLLSANIDLVEKVSSLSEPLHKIATVQATSTAAEADDFAVAIKEGKVPAAVSKLINTGLIDRYATLWGIEPLDHKGTSYKKPYLDLNSSVVSKTRQNLYGKPKIIFAKLALHIEGFPDVLGEYASVNTNCAYDSKYALAYVCALVNSRLLSFVYAEYFGSLIMSGGYFQFQAPQLGVLPIRRIAFTTPKKQRARVVEEGKQLYQGFLKTRDPVPTLDLVEQCLPKDDEGNFVQEEEKSDVVHDLLAYLAEQMIELNRQKQKEIQGFLKWIEREWEVDIEALALKTHLKEYHEYDFNEMLRIAKRNKKLIKPDPESREFQERLEREWNASMGKLRPLKEKIQLTDNLIDQIVYNLYGLTGEEIEIVEGSSS